jgi:hypothetical protein
VALVFFRVELGFDEESIKISNVQERAITAILSTGRHRQSAIRENNHIEPIECLVCEPIDCKVDRIHINFVPKRYKLIIGDNQLIPFS